MATTNGTATDYLDLMAKFNTFVTGLSAEMHGRMIDPVRRNISGRRRDRSVLRLIL